jgi:hypothetical protein
MKISEKIQNMKGRLHLIAFDSEGNQIWEADEQNLIVNSGFNLVTQAIAGQSDAYIQYIAVGTNGVPPATPDTAITDAQLVEISGVDYPSSSTVRFNFTIGYQQCNGMIIREFGLMGANGQLFSRKTREAIEKTGQMSIVGFWDITIAELPAMCQVVIVPDAGIETVEGAGMVVINSTVQLNCTTKENFNFAGWLDLNTGETYSANQSVSLIVDRSYLLKAVTQSTIPEQSLILGLTDLNNNDSNFEIALIN